MSAMKKTTERAISARPATFTCRMANDARARTRAMAPITPGRTAPGLLSSKMMP